MPIFITPEQLNDAIRLITTSLPECAYLAPDEDRCLSTGDRLPHSQAIGKIQHVTWRTADSIPQEKARVLLNESNQFRLTHPEPWDTSTVNEYRNKWEKKINSLIDKGYGECLLKRYPNRKKIMQVINGLSQSEADIIAFVIMPNHVHLLLQNFIPLDVLIDRIKGMSAVEINKLNGRKGTFWFRNYFDRMMRTEYQLESTIYYIVNNPRYLLSGDYSIWIKDVGEIYADRRFGRPN